LKPWFKKQGDRIAIIIASKDRDDATFKAKTFPSGSPFLAFKFGDSHIAALSAKYKIGGVPYLSIISLSGKLIEQEGDAQLSETDVISKWVAKGKTL